MKDEDISRIAKILLEEQKNRNLSIRLEKLKRILCLLAKGSALVFAISAPNSPKLIRQILSEKSDWQEWKKFNKHYLYKTLNSLNKQKLIEFNENKRIVTIKISESGKKRILKYGVDSLNIPKPLVWDGKWRLIVYDVLSSKRSIRDKFRIFLNQAGFLQFQESVYLYPYSCSQEIDFLKYYLGIGNEVRIMLVEKIDNDKEFRNYFGL